MGLDGAHKVSGSNALHVHIDNTVTAGGRLFADGDQPIFANKPTHVYGRMMMYIDPNGTSVHWTFFGVNGDAEPSSPAVGRNASYIMSSLPKSGVNTYSFVYGLQAQEATASTTARPRARRRCPRVGLHLLRDGLGGSQAAHVQGRRGGPDPVRRRSRQWLRRAHVGHLPWYGPAITQLFVGAWSFHAMNAPLDVWIDDLVVDTKPVACPSP